MGFLKGFRKDKTKEQAATLPEATVDSPRVEQSTTAAVAPEKIELERGQNPEKDIPDHYRHVKHAGNHGDVLKHVIYTALIKELQKQHPEGLHIFDTHSGSGLYDLGQQESGEFEHGVMRVGQNIEENSPPPVVEYWKMFEDTDSYMQLYPGSPLLAERLLREGIDELDLFDLYVDQVVGMKNPVEIVNIDSFDPINTTYFVPEDGKHPVILIDPPYTDKDDHHAAQALMERILNHNPAATVMIWAPLIENHRYRYGYLKTLKEKGKRLTTTGHYSASIIVQKSGFQGSVVFIANPTNNFDQVMDEDTVDWISMMLVTSGRSDFVVEQWVKKVKTKKREQGTIENMPTNIPDVKHRT